MEENQSPSPELLELEAKGWKSNAEGWYLPNSTMHNPVTYQDALTMQKVLNEWNVESSKRN